MFLRLHLVFPPRAGTTVSPKPFSMSASGSSSGSTAQDLSNADVAPATGLPEGTRLSSHGTQGQGERAASKVLAPHFHSDPKVAPRGLLPSLYC